MSYRRIVLIIFACFIGYLLYAVVMMDTSTSGGAIWPLMTGLLVILMLPEKRLGGEKIIELLKAMKGSSHAS